MSRMKIVLIMGDGVDTAEFAEVAPGKTGGYTTLSADSGMSGLAKAKEAKPDLIVLDVRMKPEDGFEVFVDLKRDPATKDIPVAMLTGIVQEVGIGFSAREMSCVLGEQPDAFIENPVQAVESRETVAKTPSVQAVLNRTRRRCRGTRTGDVSAF